MTVLLNNSCNLRSSKDAPIFDKLEISWKTKWVFKDLNFASEIDRVSKHLKPTLLPLAPRAFTKNIISFSSIQSTFFLNEPHFEWQAKRSFHSLHFGIHSKFIMGFRSPLFRFVFMRRLSSLRVSWSERNISYMLAHRTLTFSESISLVLASEEMRKLWFSSRWRQLWKSQKITKKNSSFIEEATIMFRFIEQHSHYVPSDSHSYLMSRRPPSHPRPNPNVAKVMKTQKKTPDAPWTDVTFAWAYTPRDMWRRDFFLAWQHVDLDYGENKSREKFSSPSNGEFAPLAIRKSHQHVTRQLFFSFLVQTFSHQSICWSETISRLYISQNAYMIIMFNVCVCVKAYYVCI